MRFSEINENSMEKAHVAFDVEQRKKFINDNLDLITKYVKGGGYIYRGMYATEHMMLADGRKLNRKSANTSNIYTLLLQTFPEWEQFPPRNKSFICASDEGIAGNYGVVYVVIPLENQPIGVCPLDDFWPSFTNSLEKFNAPDDGFEDLSDLNIMVETMWNNAREMKLVKGKLVSTNPAKLVEQLNQLTAAIRTKEFISKYVSTDIERAAVKKGIVGLYQYIMNPKRNGFRLVDSPRKLRNERNSDNEVWLSGKVLMLPIHFFKRLAEDINEDY